MAESPNHDEALVSYRDQLADIDRKIRNLQRDRQAIALIVQGLELLAGKPVTAPATVPMRIGDKRLFVGEHITSSFDLLSSQPMAPSVPDELSTLGMAVQALRRVNTRGVRGAKRIQRMIAETLGKDVNYQTLYKALKRDSTRRNGLVYEVAGMFGLREWKTTNTESE